ncbi:hypothetical protein FB451DRAFT_1418010 [Mycena latifolia]|nr:hypothetical protein FB451DRAFT_1418010 [Mycena latifolia]
MNPRAVARSSFLPPSNSPLASLNSIDAIFTPDDLCAAAPTISRIIRLLSLNLPDCPSLRSPPAHPSYAATTVWPCASPIFAREAETTPVQSSPLNDVSHVRFRLAIPPRATFKLLFSLSALALSALGHLRRTLNCGCTLLFCYGANLKILVALVLQCRWLPFDSAPDSDAALYSAREVCSGHGSTISISIPALHVSLLLSRATASLGPPSPQDLLHVFTLVNHTSNYHNQPSAPLHIPPGNQPNKHSTLLLRHAPPPTRLLH